MRVNPDHGISGWNPCDYRLNRAKTRRDPLPEVVSSMPVITLADGGLTSSLKGQIRHVAKTPWHL
jgi:hypothetical protein